MLAALIGRGVGALRWEATPLGRGRQGTVPLMGQEVHALALPVASLLSLAACRASKLCGPRVQDEAIAKMNADKLRKLKPFFRPQGGTITGARAA